MPSASIVHYPVEFDLGPLTLTGFGIAMLLAFLVAQVLAQSELTRRGHDPEIMADAIFAAVVGGLLGGKIYYAILTGDMTSLFSRAGLVFWGGLLGGIIATAAVIRWRKWPFTRVSDVSAIGISGAYAVGRSGCWAVGDDYGRPWDGPLAVSFPQGAPPSTVANLSQMFGIQFPPGTPPGQVVPVHPTQLYEVGMALIMFAIIMRYRDHRHAEGWLFGLYCVLAGVERFIVEFFRAKDDRFFGPLTMAQVIAIAFVAAGLVWMRMRTSTGDGRPGIYGPARASASSG
jgi:phosphatidylglycerol---prolipoprotein diacylglyceryl transferase